MPEEKMQSERRKSLSENPASWIIKNKETGEAVVELFEKSLVEKINKEKYEAVPIIDYLENLNKNLKNLSNY